MGWASAGFRWAAQGLGQPEEPDQPLPGQPGEIGSR